MTDYTPETDEVRTVYLGYDAPYATGFDPIVSVYLGGKRGFPMRLSPSRYPEYVDFYCSPCNTDNDDVRVDSIEDESVRVECPECGEPTYVKVVD